MGVRFIRYAAILTILGYKSCSKRKSNLRARALVRRVLPVLLACPFCAGVYSTLSSIAIPLFRKYSTTLVDIELSLSI